MTPLVAGDIDTVVACLERQFAHTRSVLPVHETPEADASTRTRTPGSLPEVVAGAGCLLGEGPLWDSDAGLLRWVDIDGLRVWSWDPRSGHARSAEVAQAVGAIVPAVGGGLVVAARDGVGRLDPVRGVLTLLARFPDGDGRRANDAKCDRRGRLWVGVMDCELRPGRGSLYRVDPDGAIHLALDGLTIPNGLGWSPDDRTMYFVDSRAHGIDAYAFDAETGRLGPRKRLADVPEAEGLVDGLAVNGARAASGSRCASAERCDATPLPASCWRHTSCPSRRRRAARSAARTATSCSSPPGGAGLRPSGWSASPTPAACSACAPA